MRKNRRQILSRTNRAKKVNNDEQYAFFRTSRQRYNRHAPRPQNKLSHIIIIFNNQVAFSQSDFIPWLAINVYLCNVGTTTTSKNVLVIWSQLSITPFMICDFYCNVLLTRNCLTRIPEEEDVKVISTSFRIWYTWPYMS